MKPNTILSLTDQQFQCDSKSCNLIPSFAGHTFVMFVMKGCKFCQQATPEFQTLPSFVRNSVSIATASSDDCVQACEKLHIQSFPSFVLFVDGGAQIYRYENPQRTVAHWMEFLRSHIRRYEASHGVWTKPTRIKFQQSLP